MKPSRKTYARESEKLFARQREQRSLLKQKFEEMSRVLEEEYEIGSRALEVHQMAETFSLRARYGHHLSPAAEAIIEKARNFKPEARR